SLHSVTKLSASKCLSAKRRNATERTPGVRKKLRLCSESSSFVFIKQEVKNRQSPNFVPSGPDEPAVFREDVLNRLLEEELESAGTQTQRLASSPPRPLGPSSSPIASKYAHVQKLIFLLALLNGSLK
ncbi:hypothetical protein ILYODFUR_038601, partial [Ilyodon furcidens]